MTVDCPAITVTAPLIEPNITGKVTDFNTGAVLSGAIVYLTSGTLQSPIEVANTTTDSNGNYSFTNVNPGSYFVACDMTGYGSAGIVAITVTSGVTTTANILLSVTLPITATSITPSKTSCQAPCTLSVDVTWTNQGGGIEGTSLGIQIDSNPPTFYYPTGGDFLNPGESISHSFSISNLTQGSHTICPIPN